MIVNNVRFHTIGIMVAKLSTLRYAPYFSDIALTNRCFFSKPTTLLKVSH